MAIRVRAPSPILALCLAATAPAQSTALDFPALLRRLADVQWLHRPPALGEHSVQFSSYDRRSDKGPGNADDWYSNDDRGKYLRVDERDGGKEYVMCDTKGPGVVTRIWSANPGGTIHFDVDGVRVWSVDMAQLCSGRIAPIVEPLAGMHSKGGNCFLPIPFGKSIVVSATQGDLYYHVDVLYPGRGTAVESFQPAMLQKHQAAIEATCRALVVPPLALSPLQEFDAEGRPVPGACLHATPALPPGTLVTRFGVCWEQAPPGDLGELLRGVLLVVRCGQEETVRVPVLDFFGGGPDWRPHHGAFLAVDERSAWCGWPMPMPQGGEIRLERDGGPAQGGGDAWLPCLAAVEMVAGAARADDLLFRASYHLEKGFPSRPWRDFLVLDANGAGRFVGTALLVKNPHRAWWGEGDEKFYVDNETFPSWFGTGTEDYFGYAWCCPEPFSAALHGQPECDGPHNYGFTAVHRMHVLDSVPFQRAFKFDLEVWHWVPKLQLDYATVAYWYGAAGAQSGLPPVPAAAARTLDRLPKPKVMVVDGALEGEALQVLSCSGGKHTVQETWFVEGGFSRDAQLWWMDGKQGDSLVLALPVAQAGRYRLKAAFAKARDYGIVQCALGEDLGAPIDLYSPDIAASGPLDLGEVELPAGAAKFTLRITGHNEAAEPRHMVGLDYILLEPVR